MFDKDKLTFINHTYIKMSEKILRVCKTILENTGIKKEDWLLNLVQCYKMMLLVLKLLIYIMSFKKFKLTEGL